MKTGRFSVLLASFVALPLATLGCSGSKEEPAASSASPSAAPATSGAPSAKGSKGAADTGDGEVKPPSAGEHVPVFKSHELPAPSKDVAGFTPSAGGFKFQNYGNDKGFTNLTALELRRMFGDKVCASLEGDTCLLTPQATEWMEAMNKGMGGGHCEGFAALSLLMQRGQIDPKVFGADGPNALDIDGNDKLQREIAYWFVTQGVMPMAKAEDKTLSPVEVVAKIEESLKGGAESYTLGIYMPGYKAGHATTPYGIQEKENDIVWILHYDNNYPGEEKHIEVDKKANTWAYTTAADPNGAETGYKGDASTKTLTIAPSTVRTGPLFCHFCGDVDAAGGDAAKGSAGAVAMREIMMEGDGDLLITDETGKRLGYAGDVFVNEIQGAVFAPERSGDPDGEPDYFLPVGKKLKVSLDGSDLQADSSSDVVLVGPGYTLGVEGISLGKGQRDELEFAADWSEFRYTTKQSETPTLTLGIETSKADYAIEVNVAGDGDGQVVILGVDIAKGLFALNVDGGPAKSDFSVELTMSTDKGEETFEHKGIDVGADQIALFDYGAWKGNKTPLHVVITDDKGNVVEQTDEADEE